MIGDAEVVYHAWADVDVIYFGGAVIAQIVDLKGADPSAAVPLTPRLLNVKVSPEAGGRERIAWAGLNRHGLVFLVNVKLPAHARISNLVVNFIN